MQRLLGGGMLRRYLYAVKLLLTKLAHLQDVRRSTRLAGDWSLRRGSRGANLYKLPREFWTLNPLPRTDYSHGVYVDEDNDVDDGEDG